MSSTNAGDTNGLSDYGFTGDSVDTNDIVGSFGETNVSVETGAFTNLADATAWLATQDVVNESALSDFIEGLNPASFDDVFAAPDMTINIGYGTGSKVMDLNPMDNSLVAPLFGWMRDLWIWLMSVFYLQRCAKDSIEAVRLMEEARGINAAGVAPVARKTYY